MLYDHLKGGYYHEDSVTEQTRVETTSVPSTNTRSERDFAVLDRLLRQKPNARVISLENIVLYAHHRTSEWLDGKSPEEKKKIFAAAVKASSEQQKLFKERQEEIRHRRLEVLKQKQADISRSFYSLLGLLLSRMKAPRNCTVTLRRINPKFSRTAGTMYFTL